MKSANILLDENLEAKISDFGLSRTGPRNQQQTQLHTSVAGTSYYLDPHYNVTQTLKKESDVYSFGVVLFEILCGRLVFPKNNRLPGLVELVHWHKDVGLDQIIDPRIKDQIEPISLRTYTEIAYRCIKLNYMKRPMMSIVVEKLVEALQSQDNHDFEVRFQKELYFFVWAEIMVDKDNHDFEVRFQKELYFFVWAEIMVDKENHDFEELIQKEVYSFVCAEIEANKVWEQRMLHEYKEIIKRSDAHAAYNTAHEIYSLLSHGVLIDGGNKWFCLSKLNGKNCVVISAMELFKENEGEIIRWKTVPGSRFVKVRDFQARGDITFKIEITTRMLSLKSTYAIFLICKPKVPKFRPSPSSIFPLKYGSKGIFSYSSEWRDEQWGCMELCHFTNDLEVATFEFHFSWRYYDRDHIEYLEGIEFRPIDMDTEARVEELPKSELDTVQKKMLPNYYEEILKRSNNILHYTTKKQLYYFLAKGIFIDDNLMWFWLDKSNGKICIMLSPKAMMINQDGGTTSIEESKMSRFSWVIKSPGIGSLEIGGHMKAHMLSPKTSYVAWLVFKCHEQMYCTYGDHIAWLTLGEQEQKTRYVYLFNSSDMIRPLNDPESKNGMNVSGSYVVNNKKKLDRRPRERDDGWLEVQLFPFFNDMDAHEEVKVGLKMKKMFDHLRFEVNGIEFRPQGN